MTRIWAGEQKIAYADKQNSDILLMAGSIYSYPLGTATHLHMVSLESWLTDCQQLVYRHPGFLSKSGGTYCKSVTVFPLLVLSSLTKGHSLGINIHQTSTNKMTPQQQVLWCP